MVFWFFIYFYESYCDIPTENSITSGLEMLHFLVKIHSFVICGLFGNV